MVNIVICENDMNDQEFVRSKVVDILDDFNIEYEIKIYSSGESLIEAYKKDTDIILMDIQMDGIDGIETAREIRKVDDKVEIIFVTSFVEYALEGYEVKAYRYLLKPVKYDKFYHGIGIESIKSSINKYEGDIRIKEEEEKFVVSIYLPMNK